MQKSIFDGFRNQRAQSGMNAAILIAIISGLIVLYIIFLPSGERLELIGENDSRGDSGSDDEKILIEDKSIIMEYIGEDEIDHDLPSVNLYTSTEASTIREENMVYVKNGLFDKQEKEIEFKVSEPENTKNVLISFYSKKKKGRLIITLNDHEIFNNEIEKVNVDPIKISKDFVAANNNLKLEASGVGMAFWSTNEFLLENFKITADVTDTSTRESVINFIVPQSESRNIEKARLRFVPECQPENVGTLEILINNHGIYSSVPDCGTPRPLDFSPTNIITGENKLVFRSDRGRYLIDQIKITTELKEASSYTYFFDVDEDLIEDIEDDKKSVNLTFYFVDDKEDKEAEIIINSRKTYMTSHNDFEWSTNIDRYLEEGSNSLKIIPEERMEIRKLQVRAEDN
ncbi:MAG: hypothetical protein KAK00_01130 [Nanoarchaeota archaeon]|nr:hypothetical protein [Thermodesulfovibrionia bacterium]MCK5281987.1 hypothetical protein [Nanoarchaeota archaeon]